MPLNRTINLNKMGTIASVLQWSCTNCNVINPTESLKCLNCGTVRKVCEGTLKHLSDSNSLRISKNSNNVGGSGVGGKEPAIPGDNKSSTTTLSTYKRQQQPQHLQELQQIQQQTLQVTPISSQALETERDETLANRYVCILFSRI